MDANLVPEISGNAYIKMSESYEWYFGFGRFLNCQIFTTDTLAIEIKIK